LVRAADPGGATIASNLSWPATLRFTVKADGVPLETKASELTVAFWNGTAWVVLPSAVARNADGSYTVTAATDHFTLFGVLRVSGLGLLTPQPLLSGVNPASWGGGDLTQLLAQAPNARSIWVFFGGNAFGYIVGAPDFVNQPFRALFPAGFVPERTIVFVVLP
jgi:hypothetical protein